MSFWKIIGMVLFTLAACLVAFLVARADETPIVSWNDFTQKELRVERFELLRPTSVSIQGMGLKPLYDRAADNLDEALAYGWILDLESRKPVWSMPREMKPLRSGSQRGAARIDTKVNLPAGKYAVYYYCGIGKGESYYFNFDNDNEDFFDALRRFFKEGRNYYHFSEKDLRKLFFTVTAGRNSFRPLTSDPFAAQAIVSITMPRNSSFKSQSFKITRPTFLTVYAIGEASPAVGSQMVDLGYILDLRSRKKVWELTRSNSEPAGGAEKNRKFYGQITLPAGDYELSYATDDSHTYGRWNAAPPYDPEFYGITLLVSGEEKMKIAPVERPKEPVIVQFLRAGNNELLSAGFALAKPMDLHIYAIGEHSSGDDYFADYGFIENASTGRRAWEMTFSNTGPAGGADKNRMFDGIVHFSPGEYVVHYVSDGSHAYGDWNSTAPYDEEHWGIVVAGVPGSFDPKAVRPFSGDVQAKDVVVQLVGLKDDEDREKGFRLTKTTSLRIYAVGEGSRDEMYDYGWIENNQSGRTVWEMNWRNTLPAGGASKNRMFDDVVILPPGGYSVHFVTDGSHSTGDWNATPPKDPFHWGITISLAQ